jgi:hypothetical protein
MAGPSIAWPTFASVIGSRETTARSRCTGTDSVTCSVSTVLTSFARPASSRCLAIASSSSVRVIAWSVVGPEVS